MILPPALVLGVHLLMPVADDVPTLNVDQVCQGIAQQGGVTFHDAAVGEEKKNCIDSEKAIRDQVVKEWSTFAAPDKVACTNESRTGGEASYTELLTCLEMARDVRAMNSDEKGSATQIPPVQGANQGAKSKQP
jgi:hypothetical protein